MQLSRSTFRTFEYLSRIVVTMAAVLCIASLFIGDELVLPWQTVPSYVRVPLFIEYFKLNGQAFGITPDQVLVWQHYATGAYQHLVWTDYALFGLFFLSLVVISVTLTYLSRPIYLFCTGIMLLCLMQLNLAELGFIPEYINYLSLFVFGGTTYFFQSIKPGLSVFTRTLSIVLIYGAFCLLLGQMAPIPAPISANLSFGLFTPLLVVALMLLFLGGDNMHALFTLATKSAPNGKNGLIHFMTIGLVYLIVLALLFLEKTGQITLNLWLISPYTILLLSLVTGYMNMNSKLELSEHMPVELIKRWLYPVMAALTLVMVAYAEFTDNDSLAGALEMSILATHLGGATVFYLYAFINYTPALLSNTPIDNFLKGFRAPLLTARALYVIFIVGVFFYLDSQPYYQARAARYTALGSLAQRLDSELLAAEYHKQAVFYDFYSFKSNYALSRLERNQGNRAGQIENLQSATVRDPQAKGAIALSNFYSEQDQLFSKLLALKKTVGENPLVTNNLGIAHFELQQRDSAMLAFNKSESLSDTEIVAANKLALSYYTPPQAMARGTLPAFDSSDPKGIINYQAFANLKKIASTQTLPLAADTILLQDDLFYLYNSSLSPQPNYAYTLQALDYYLTNDRNRALRDFLFLGRGIMQYNQGQVNEAFENIISLMAIDMRNTARYNYILGVWAAYEGAHKQAHEYLDLAIGQGHEVDNAQKLKAALEENSVPLRARSLPELADADVATLQTIATQNAFDEVLTLAALEALKDKIPASELYELAREAVSTNLYSVELTVFYAERAIEAGLSSFGRNALEDMKDWVPEAIYLKMVDDFEKKLTDWRNRPIG